MSANNNSVLPRLPGWRTLLEWLKARPAATLSRRFNLESSDSKDEATCPVLLYLKETYGFQEVKADSWTTICAIGYGVTLVFDVTDEPASLGLMNSLRIAHDELAKACPSGYTPLSRDEVATLVIGWENPHDAVHAVLHARRLDAAPDVPVATPA